MKTKLFSFLLSLSFFNLFSQTNPTIAGDVMLCPNTNGTAMITSSETYDTYQWQYKYWFLSGNFQDIAGANSSSFTYDWYTYDQALLKVVVTKNGTTYESNEIQIDSYAFASLSISLTPSANVEIDPMNGEYLICDGDFIDCTVQTPYTNVQWFKDGQLIAGANQINYTITSSGAYTVEGSPDTCPNFVQNSFPIIIRDNTDCTLSLQQKNLEELVLLQNPVKNVLKLKTPGNNELTEVSIYSLNGKQVVKKTSNNLTEINVENLSSGVYILKVESNNSFKHIKFIKE